MRFSNLFAKLISTTRSSTPFGETVGYDHIKRLFRMALESGSAIHILLVGPPASAKTMFLTSLMRHLENSYFADGSSSSKAGMIDYMFANSPRYLLIDEIDKMARKDQAFLLNLMETGIVSETKYGKTRDTKMETLVFATSNDIRNLSGPLQSRFFIVELEPYTHEQFYQITMRLLYGHANVAPLIADAVWNKSRDIRDCVKIGKMAKNISDVEFIIDNFFVKSGELYWINEGVK